MFKKVTIRTFRENGSYLTLVLPEDECGYLAIGSGFRDDHMVRLSPERLRGIAEILQTGPSGRIEAGDSEIRILAANRGDPWREGVEISFRTERDTLGAMFLETRDAAELAALILAACERFPEQPAP